MALMTSWPTSPAPRAAAPRFATPRDPAAPTFGPAVARVSATLGAPFMPWQQQVSDVALEVERDGSWRYRIVIVTVQRQAGKTTETGAVHIHRALTRPGRTWFTAQRRQDARDTWLDVAEKVKRSPLGPIAKVRKSNGSETVSFPGGGTFRVFAPAEDALHGKANELVTVDEGWAFDAARGAALEQAIMPTFTTTGGQLWIVSTAGSALSAWLRGYVERGRAAVRAGQRSTVAYFEWALPDEQIGLVAAGLASDAAPADRAAALAAVLAAHPGAGYTLRVDALEQAAAVMPPGEFLRAYGNVWTAAEERVIGEHEWAAVCQDSWPPPEVPVALAFDVDVDRSAAAIGAAWRDTPAGPLRVDVVDRRPGTGWLADRLRELRDRWRPVGIGYDRMGAALDVADELTRGGLELQPTGAREYATACSAFLAAVVDRRLAHPGRPVLDDAVAAAATRPLGDSFAWSRRISAGSIAPLAAVTVAAYTYDHRPPPPLRPVVVARRRR